MFYGDTIYLFRIAQLNTVYIKIYTIFLFSEVRIHTIVNRKRCKIYDVIDIKYKLS